jgi:MFS family permease
LGANLLTLLVYAALGGALFYLPFELIRVEGYAASAAGLALVPFILAISLLSRASGWLLVRTGSRFLLTVGPLVTAVGFALCTRSGGYLTTLLPAVLALGVGMGLTVAPLTTAVMDAAPAGRSGTASGINNAVARAAGLMAIAGFGVIAGGSLVAGFAPIMLVAAGLSVAGGVIGALTMNPR